MMSRVPAPRGDDLQGHYYYPKPSAKKFKKIYKKHE
jgi:hypothetical protein